MHNVQVRNGHDEITQQDLIDVLDKQLFEGMGVSMTDDEQQRIKQTVRSYLDTLIMFETLIQF